MITLQEDLIEIYNSLTVFSSTTLDPKFPKPVKVYFRGEDNQVVFEQGPISVRMSILLYYCLDLESITDPSYLLPGDYDYLMNTLQTLIASGELIKERVTLSPENVGFDIFGVDLREFKKGPKILGSIRFVSGTSWLFKLYTRFKYGKQ